MSSRLFIQDPIYQSPVGGGRRFAEAKCRRGRADVYTDTDKMALSFWLRDSRGHADVLLWNLNSKEKMFAGFWWLLCLQLKDNSVIYFYTTPLMDTSLCAEH